MNFRQESEMRGSKWDLRTQILLMIVAAGLLYLNVRTVVIPDGMATAIENGFPIVFWARWGVLNANGSFQTVEEGFHVKFLVLNIAVNAVILVATLFVLRRLFAVNSGKDGNGLK